MSEEQSRLLEAAEAKAEYLARDRDKVVQRLHDERERLVGERDGWKARAEGRQADLVTNASMLARQTDLAREAENERDESDETMFKALARAGEAEARLAVAMGALEAVRDEARRITQSPNTGVGSAASYQRAEAETAGQLGRIAYKGLVVELPASKRLRIIVKVAEAETEAEDAVTALDEKVHVRGAPFTEFCNLMDAQTAASEARRKAVHGERGE